MLREVQKSKTLAQKMALQFLEVWNQYLHGEVYGFVVEDGEGNHLESCYGFYGDPKESGCEAQAIEAAEMASELIRKEEESHATKVKRALGIVDALKEGNVIEDEEAGLLSFFIHRP